MNINAEKIKELVTKNFQKYNDLLENNVEEPRKTKIKKLVNHFGDRMILCPSSFREDYHCAFPGGWLEHVIRTYEYMLELNKLGEYKISPDSLTVVGLLHDVGKFGTISKPLFIPNTNDWEVKKGIMYSYNKEVPFMIPVHRSLWIIQKFQIPLSSDEFSAILLKNGASENGNDKYLMNEPDLADLLYQSAKMAAKKAKDLYFNNSENSSPE